MKLFYGQYNASAWTESRQYAFKLFNNLKKRGLRVRIVPKRDGSLYIYWYVQ